LGPQDAFDFVPGQSVGTITASSTDLFEFSGKYGNDTIGSFRPGSGPAHDTIQFASNDFTSFAQVQSAMSQVGANVVIRLDATDAITLLNKSVASLVAADFKFVAAAPAAVASAQGVTETSATSTATDASLHASAALLIQYAATGFASAPDPGAGAGLTVTPPPASSVGLVANPHFG
jgi:hypothetical protein